ncbi:MAG: hypothetical protein ACR2HR_02230 [Euzebya sp.]
MTTDELTFVIQLDPDSYTCPACGWIVVPTDDRAPSAESSHTCADNGDPRPAAASPVTGS